MHKIRVEICSGTTCYLLGAAEILADIAGEDNRLPDALKNRVEILGSPCLDACCDRNYDHAPFVRVGDRVISDATVEKVIAAIWAIVGDEEGGTL